MNRFCNRVANVGVCLYNKNILLLQYEIYNYYCNREKAQISINTQFLIYIVMSFLYKLPFFIRVVYV